jgi:16S rRNA (cytidine1402-2'-O)-methyltransferase
MHSSSLMADPHPGAGLYIVGTPIGNLQDITLRALTILGTVDLIAAEDTRHTRRLLNAHGIDKRLISYHEHNEMQRSVQLIERLLQGAAVALVTNAGTPTVSDPGYRLVQAAVAQRIPIIPIPGVSAVITALSVAGLPTDQFTFVGFPARKKARRMQQLQELARLPHTLVFYQSPQRLAEFVRELKEILGDRPAVLAREMTKMHEEFVRAQLSAIGDIIQQRESVRGECTLLVSGAPADLPPSETEIDAAIRHAIALDDRSPGDIAKALAVRFKVSKKQIYDRTLALRGK